MAHPGPDPELKQLYQVVATITNDDPNINVGNTNDINNMARPGK